MSGPTAIVTGAARGIGAATVRRLARDGWKVVAVDVGADDKTVPYALGTAEQLKEVAQCGEVLPVLADVRNQDALSEAVRRAVGSYGRVDAAVGAAAVLTGGQKLWETTDEQWNPLFDVDVRGVLNLARATIPTMLAAPEPRRGRFVAFASAAAHHGLWHLGAYCAAKHAVLGIVRGLAADLKGTGINAVAVSPGSTRTDMLQATADLYGLDSVEELAHHQLAGRLLEPDEVAAVAAWACSPDGGAINGSVLHADGGFTG
jgi:SDR family mycofactocin-dependent oxidoreductase